MARREGLLNDKTPSIVSRCGLNNRASKPYPESATPHRLRTIVTPFILILGTAHFDKTKLFAVQMHNAMLQQGWSGNVVLIGSQSGNNNDSLESGRPDVAETYAPSTVFQIDEISEKERSWLLSQASLVFNPSASEDFDIIPFEAANYGTPTISSRINSLHEALQRNPSVEEKAIAALVASQCLELISDPKLSESLCLSLKRQSSQYTSDSHAQSVWRQIERVLASPKYPNKSL